MEIESRAAGWMGMAGREREFASYRFRGAASRFPFDHTQWKLRRCLKQRLDPKDHQGPPPVPMVTVPLHQTYTIVQRVLVQTCTT